MHPYPNDLQANWQQSNEAYRKQIRKWLENNDVEIFNFIKDVCDQMDGELLEIERR